MWCLAAALVLLGSSVFHDGCSSFETNETGGIAYVADCQPTSTTHIESAHATEVPGCSTCLLQHRTVGHGVALPLSFERFDPSTDLTGSQAAPSAEEPSRLYSARAPPVA